MIFVCEPQLRGISHEKVNSGFLYGLRLAFPNDKIKFYGDLSHIKALKEILLHDDVLIENIDYYPIKFTNTISFRAFFNYYFLLKKLFYDVLKSNTDKIFFLSFSPMILFILKLLKRKKFKNLNFTLVLHRDFGLLFNEEIYNSQIDLLNQKSIFKKIKETSIKNLTYKILEGIKIRTELYLTNSRVFVFEKIFSFKKVFLKNHSKSFKYIALSDHIIKNAKKHIDITKYNIFSVTLPTVFAEPRNHPKNNFPIFAIFGFGDRIMLNKILIKLKSKKLSKKYQIKIIGMDNLGFDEFEEVTFLKKGKQLSRNEMEDQAYNVDFFLSLYDKKKYMYSCSGSVMEALSYLKPIIHFDNYCINNFTSKEYPIGFFAKNIDEYVNIMVQIISNFDNYEDQFSYFKKNMIRMRNKVSIKNSSNNLKESFTF